MREKRETAYVTVIRNSSFFNSVLRVHMVLRLCRRYLLVFDCEEGVISDVVPQTLKLESELGKLKVSELTV